jgi:hypothetical protein
MPKILTAAEQQYLQRILNAQTGTIIDTFEPKAREEFAKAYVEEKTDQTQFEKRSIEEVAEVKQALPTQDQSPLSEVVLADGNIIRVYQCATGTFSNICAQLVDGNTGANIGNAVAITNSTTAHQVWPTVTAREIFYVNTGDNKVYRRPITLASNTITPGTAAAVPLFDQNSWGSGVPPHYSIDFHPSTNRTYLYGKTKNSFTTKTVLAGVYFDAQGNAASNNYYNSQVADYPYTSGQGLGMVEGTSLLFYPDVMTLATRLTINTGAIGTGGNKLRIDELNDGSRLFTWQVKNGDGSWKVLSRRLSSTNTWLDANEVTVYTLPTNNGEPQANVVVNPNGGYYIVGREICPGKTTVGVCSREFRNDGTAVNAAVSVIEDVDAQFPVGVFVNGKLSVSACELDGSTGNCTAILSNANALSPTSVPTITPTDSLTTSLTTLSQLTATTTSTTSMSMLGSSTTTTTNQNTDTTTSTLSNGSSSSDTSTIFSSSSSSSTASMFSAMSPTLATSVITNNPTTQTAALPGTASDSGSNNIGPIVGGVVGAVALIGLGIGIAWKWLRGKKDDEQNIEMQPKGNQPPEPFVGAYSSEQGQHHYAGVNAATSEGMSAEAREAAKKSSNYRSAAPIREGREDVAYADAPSLGNNNYGQLVMAPTLPLESRFTPPDSAAVAAATSSTSAKPAGRSIPAALHKEGSVAHTLPEGPTKYATASALKGNVNNLFPAVPPGEYVGEADRPAQVSASSGSKMKRKKSLHKVKQDTLETNVVDDGNDDDNAAVEARERRKKAEPADAPSTPYGDLDKVQPRFGQFQ